MVRTTLLRFLVDDAMMQLLSTHTNARTTRKFFQLEHTKRGRVPQ